MVACNADEQGEISLKDYSLYNPLYGFKFID